MLFSSPKAPASPPRRSPLLCPPSSVLLQSESLQLQPSSEPSPTLTSENLALPAFPGRGAGGRGGKKDYLVTIYLCDGRGVAACMHLPGAEEKMGLGKVSLFFPPTRQSGQDLHQVRRKDEVKGAPERMQSAFLSSALRQVRVRKALGCLQQPCCLAGGCTMG